MSATTFASCSFRSARLPSANTRTGASYFLIRSTRPARWYSAPNAVFMNPSMISPLVNVFFSTRWRAAMAAISADAGGGETTVSNAIAAKAAASIRRTWKDRSRALICNDAAARHMARQVGPPRQHLRGRGPARPFLFRGDAVDAGPAKAVAADTDPVAKRLALRQDEVKPPLGGVDVNGAGLILAYKAHHLAPGRA